MAKYKALKIKRESITTFLKDHSQEDLNLYIGSYFYPLRTNALEQLRTFACSAGGLVDDEFRAIIWPVLAANLISFDEDQDDALSSDSDFESAVSEFSESPDFIEVKLFIRNMTTILGGK